MRVSYLLGRSHWSSIFCVTIGAATQAGQSRLEPHLLTLRCLPSLMYHISVRSYVEHHLRYVHCLHGNILGTERTCGPNCARLQRTDPETFSGWKWTGLVDSTYISDSKMKPSRSRSKRLTHGPGHPTCVHQQQRIFAGLHPSYPTSSASDCDSVLHRGSSCNNWRHASFGTIGANMTSTSASDCRTESWKFYVVVIPTDMDVSEAWTCCRVDRHSQSFAHSTYFPPYICHCRRTLTQCLLFSRRSCASLHPVLHTYGRQAHIALRHSWWVWMRQVNAINLPMIVAPDKCSELLHWQSESRARARARVLTLFYFVCFYCTIAPTSSRQQEVISSRVLMTPMTVWRRVKAYATQGPGSRWPCSPWPWCCL